jgi:hypothetical protein
MSSIFENIFNKGKKEFLERKENAIFTLNEMAESVQHEGELFPIARQAYTESFKQFKVGKFDLSEESIKIYKDITGLKSSDDVTNTLLSFTRHDPDKFVILLKHLGGKLIKGNPTRSTAPDLILPRLKIMVREGKQGLSRQEWTSMVHSFYKMKGKSLPATSPDKPNPYWSFTTLCHGGGSKKGDIPHPFRILSADWNGREISGWSFTEKARKYLSA